MAYFRAYGVGVVAASVCTDLSIEEATERLNSEYPTGISSAWEPDPAPTFADGTPNPSPCNDHPETRKHYLFHC